ncbi:hypothetical protein K450DRAFT_254918 [Umbelopsis ramanniana AG]|uniref:Uncharacterized protein n=1 Tax=Umbelopsis ramanniana AG TaxID=1314678 RepID=A0AAD5E4V1_UMBRA|nr:uncharacterized protein K450DRAFT_254918 [Umbelopsis ramanniana AG]KAI8576789.1 hypothetical protein K450DRAFT_254918 [Umbelopsis ramanniana AG]
MWGTKRLLEKGGVAKVLKDMINQLVELVCNTESSVRQLYTVGYIISGLSMELMVMDFPKGYSCRIARSKQYDVPSSAEQVKSKLLPLMSVLIASKLLVLRVMKQWKVMSILAPNSEVH